MKNIILFILIFMPCLAYADAIEELEGRGVQRSDIEKVRMGIYENPQYKGLQAAIYYCDLLKTKIELDHAISSEKKIKGRSGSPSYSRVEALDNSYSLNSSEITEQKRLYKIAFKKTLAPGICKSTHDLSQQLDSVHDQLLLKAFAAQGKK
jgi:hypothetical protein